MSHRGGQKRVTNGAGPPAPLQYKFKLIIEGLILLEKILTKVKYNNFIGVIMLIYITITFKIFKIFKG